jgi:hypothetical protein
VVSVDTRKQLIGQITNGDRERAPRLAGEVVGVDLDRVRGAYVDIADRVNLEF